ncbi:MAG: hypothetical protein KGJ49_00020 [Alphaproteobacteria bacterium]|nr:hypothetical protein [Alphaproteobacteria bacterium]
MSETKSISIRLAPGEIEQLQARAYSLSANVAAVARDLIRAGLAGGDNKALAEQLMLIERKLVGLEQQSRDTNAKTEAIDVSARKLVAMFEALLQALTVERAA